MIDILATSPSASAMPEFSSGLVRISPPRATGDPLPSTVSIEDARRPRALHWMLTSDLVIFAHFAFNASQGLLAPVLLQIVVLSFLPRDVSRPHTSTSLYMLYFGQCYAQNNKLATEAGSQRPQMYTKRQKESDVHVVSSLFPICRLEQTSP